MAEWEVLTAGRDCARPALVARSAVKRGFDIVVASAALLILAPLLILITGLVRLEDGGPALFRQRRTGLGGAAFVILKFRSMTVAEDGADIQQARRGDQRVTRIGATLRRLSLDELPQLINVLRGDMSLVGPRPHALSHDTRWSRAIPDYALRFRARPGLTGYAQVQGLRGEVRDLDEVRARIAADNAYIDRWSLRLELSILLRTVPLLFFDPRAY
ncbi:sugar transferase [Phenylobacterium sp.]|uniref:sugar transferase n=1 Tax=Phenylobacterium sp. TaxID=1871053 RepID=UPI0035AE5F19